MDIAKAFDKVNRTLLWATLYKKGLPIDMITHIRRGHQNATLLPKTRGKYGATTENNVGVFQGSALSALLFIIYQDDVMGNYDALNHANNLPIRHIIERTQNEVDRNVSNQIRDEFERLGKK